MSSPDSRLTRLLEAYFDGTISPADRQELEQRLREEATAREAYRDAASWHAAFSTWGEQHAGREAATSERGEPPSRRIVKFGPLWLGLLAACVALVALGAWRYGRARHALAEVTYTVDAVWRGPAPVDGDPMHRGRYELTSGMVRFETALGAVVTLAGPAKFHFVASDRIELASGKLTARMLRKSSRLTVKVGEMEVRDLGTAFGVDANHAGQTLVSVFDGLVAVKSRQAPGGEVQVAEGQSFVRGETGRVERAEFNPEVFRELWPLTVGIDEASKLVEFLPPGPLLRPLREYRADDRLFLFPEQQSTLVPRPLAIDLSPEVRSWPDWPTSPFPLPRGVRVDSYLVFFQPNISAHRVRRLSGEITFQRRILGVICCDPGLDDADQVLGDRAADYKTPGERRGLEEGDKENDRGIRLPHDRVTLSPDGHTVRFDFYVAGEREQLRVIVAAD